MLVFSQMAGFPEEDYDRFQDWVERIIYLRTQDPEETSRAADEVVSYFYELREHRLREPRRDDLVGRLLAAEVDGRELSSEEFADYCFLLLIAGLETTAWSVRASLWHLAGHAEDQAMLRARPELIPQAAEEFLRCMAPVQGMARTVRSDIDVGGKHIPAGERMLLLFGAAKRDEQIFDQPDDIKLDREDNPHLSFGVGAHRCLGANLGRRELRVALEELLAAVGEFRFAGDDVPPWWGVGPLPLALGAPPG